MSRLREQRGFTTIELLVASTIFIIVLGATLLPMDSFWKTTKTNEQRSSAQDMARQKVDQLATDVRDISGQTQLIEKATSTDLVFKTSNPFVSPNGSSNVNNDGEKRVRYCLNGSIIYRQEQTWTTASPPALPSTTNCPDTGWTTGLPTTCHTPWQSGDTCLPFATNVVNNTYPNGCMKTAGAAKPLFVYDSSTYVNIKQVVIDVQVDVTGTSTTSLACAELSTGVTLRNYFGS